MSSSTLVDQFNPIDKPNRTDYINPAKLYGLLVELTGTTDTGETLSAADAGTIQLLRGGTPFIEESFEFFHLLNDLYGGFVESTLPTAGDSTLAAVVPFYIPELPNNILDVRGDSELRYRWTFDKSTLQTRFGSNTPQVRMHTIEMRGLSEQYVLNVSQHDEQFSAQGQTSPAFGEPNVVKLMIRNPDDVLQSLQVKEGNQQIIDSLDQTTLDRITHYLNEVETDPGDFTEINLIEGTNVADVLNNGIETTVKVSGAGTVEMTLMRCDFNAARAAASADDVEQRIREAIRNAQNVPAGVR